jgi:hypothetical protein
MNNKSFFIIYFLIIYSVNLQAFSEFLSEREQLKDLNCLDSDLICASSGRSGSTMFTKFLVSKFPTSRVFKMHLLPPEKFSGKIIFLYSNPHKAAESALHQFYLDKNFSYLHVRHMESSLKEWHLELDDESNDKLLENILKLDLIGYGEQIKQWVYELENSDVTNAKVMAIKYENLWDEETLVNLANFLGIESVNLPEWKQRGDFHHELSFKERSLINTYNLGTTDHPKYQAYDFAYNLWESAPPFSFHTLKKTNK